MPTDGMNKGRRRFLVATTTVVGAVGAGFAAVPFIQSWQPSAKAQSLGAPVQVDINRLEPGQLLKVQWRGQTIGILRRTPESLRLLSEVTPDLRDPLSLESEQPSFAQNETRALKDEYLVVNMHCTHLGCVPQMVPQVGPQPFQENWKGGFFCPCHGSRFDLSGRVYKGMPAPDNLRVPPYRFIREDLIMIGAKSGAA
ncbi:MAG: ubiquinol-cytochrome c reductase iron-sulfur subunit [Proteobacteria bacterium]|nr:ubiquinol-cytochrome c reductase iron-sulfur subunit [Pseudomonadota bacterium]